MRYHRGMLPNSRQQPIVHFLRVLNISGQLLLESAVFQRGADDKTCDRQYGWDPCLG